MNYWLVADTHFSHDKLRREIKMRDDYEVLSAISKTVCNGDVLVHLGDVAFYKEREWHEAIMTKTIGARRWLILGNHDKKSTSWYLEYWHFVGRSFDMRMYGKNIHLVHDPTTAKVCGCDIVLHGHTHDNDGHREVVADARFVPVYSHGTKMVYSLKELVEGH